MAEPFTFNQEVDERSPLLSRDDQETNNKNVFVYNQQGSGLHGDVTAAVESNNATTSQSLLVSGVSSMPQGGSLLTFPTSTPVTSISSEMALGARPPGHGVVETGHIQQETNSAPASNTVYGSTRDRRDIDTVVPLEDEGATGEGEVVLPSGHTAATTPTLTPAHNPTDWQQTHMQLSCIKKYQKPILCTLFGVLPVLVVTATTILPLMLTDSCKPLNVTISVFTNDTILALNSSETKFCGQRPTISLPDYKTDQQHVHIYESDCNGLKLHPANFTYPLQTREDRTKPFTLLDGQYMTQGAHVIVNGNISVSSKVGSEIFICTFDDRDFYNKYFYANPHWKNATTSDSALQCFHQMVINETIPFKYKVQFNQTSYYYIGIAGSSLIDLVHWTYKGWTNVLDHNDYKDSELDCTDSKKCTPSKACVVAYAEPPANGRYSFSSVRTVTKKAVLTTRNIASIALGCVALVVVITILFCGCLYCYRLHKKNL